MQNNNAPFKTIMQSQWNFVSIELIQIAGSVSEKTQKILFSLYVVNFVRVFLFA